MRAGLLLLSLLAGCRFTAQSSPVGLDQAVLRPAPATKSWTVRHDLRPIGSLVRYEEATGQQRHFFVVRNDRDQDLGTIDDAGRAWRFRPHVDPELIGTGTVEDGVAGILGVESVSLQPR